LGPANKFLRKKSSVVQVNNVQHVKTKKLEVGAGAKISQRVHDDTEKLDYWNDEPESIICINYCTEAETEKIVNEGRVDIEGSKEGFLQSVPVGN